jgi:hypothetical protein
VKKPSRGAEENPLRNFLNGDPVAGPEDEREYIVLVGEPMTWDELLAELDEDEQSDDAAVDSDDELNPSA